MSAIRFPLNVVIDSKKGLAEFDAGGEVFMSVSLNKCGADMRHLLTYACASISDTAQDMSQYVEAGASS